MKNTTRIVKLRVNVLHDEETNPDDIIRAAEFLCDEVNGAVEMAEIITIVPSPPSPE